MHVSYIQATKEMAKSCDKNRDGLLLVNILHTCNQLCETSVYPSSTQRHIPEDNILHSHRCESLKSYNSVKVQHLTWKCATRYNPISLGLFFFHTYNSYLCIPSNSFPTKYCMNILFRPFRLHSQSTVSPTIIRPNNNTIKTVHCMRH
jgi:hypothetical protein